LTNLLNLLAAIALLVWGTHIVRTGVLRVYGAPLRRILARSMQGRGTAFIAGLGVTGLLQSSTATALLTSSFVAQGLLTTAAALAVMLGADVGTSLMAQIFSLDLSWLSPLLILIGVILKVLGLDPFNIMRSIQDLLRAIWNMGFDAVLWLWRYFLLGAVIVIPIWLIMRLMNAAKSR